MWNVNVIHSFIFQVPNTSPSAASVTSDLNGMAVYNACLKINERLKPYKEKSPDAQWEGWIKQAYFDRVSLSANGFYATPELNYKLAFFQNRVFSNELKILNQANWQLVSHKNTMYGTSSLIMELIFPNLLSKMFYCVFFQSELICKWLNYVHSR